ncbi:hypothetical protein [Anabaena sp. CCY 9402-a]|uniref:hypothetical protein n=1 Tax=Anabaena sp. CCY 9402-a TaxID=3103867 RepID=UPI0039C5EDA5
MSDLTQTAENTLVNDALQLFLDCYDLLGAKPDLKTLLGGVKPTPTVQITPNLEPQIEVSEPQIVDDLDNTDGIEECF